MSKVMALTNGGESAMTVCGLQVQPGATCYARLAYVPPAEWRAGAKVRYNAIDDRHELVCTNGVRIPVLDAMAG